MKKTNWTKTSEICKENGYSDEVIANIRYLESQHLFLGDLLEEYRYVQPDDEPFSERSLEIIISLYNIKSMLEAQKNITSDIEQSLEKLIKLSFQIDKPIDDFLSDDDAF